MYLQVSIWVHWRAKLFCQRMHHLPRWHSVHFSKPSKYKIVIYDNLENALAIVCRWGQPLSESSGHCTQPRNGGKHSGFLPFDFDNLKVGDQTKWRLALQFVLICARAVAIHDSNSSCTTQNHPFCRFWFKFSIHIFVRFESISCNHEWQLSRYFECNSSNLRRLISWKKHGVGLLVCLSGLFSFRLLCNRCRRHESHAVPVSCNSSRGIAVINEL